MCGQCRNPATARYQHSTRASVREWSRYSIPRCAFISKTCKVSEHQKRWWWDRWIWCHCYHAQRNDRKSWVWEEGKHPEPWQGEGNFHGCWGWGREWFGNVNHDDFDKKDTWTLDECDALFLFDSTYCFVRATLFTPMMLPTLCFCRLVTTMLDDRIS